MSPDGHVTIVYLVQPPRLTESGQEDAPRLCNDVKRGRDCAVAHRDTLYCFGIIKD